MQITFHILYFFVCVSVLGIGNAVEHSPSGGRVFAGGVGGRETKTSVSNSGS